MHHFKLCLLAVALSQLPAVLGTSCASKPEWTDAYCRANKEGSNHIFFLGGVVNKAVPESPGDETVYTMQALEVYGGSIVPNQQVTIHSDPLLGFGGAMQKGSKYLMEAHKTAGSACEYGVHICDDYNSLYDGYEEWMLEYLRDKPFMDKWC